MVKNWRFVGVQSLRSPIVPAKNKYVSSTILKKTRSACAQIIHVIKRLKFVKLNLTYKVTKLSSAFAQMKNAQRSRGNAHFRLTKMVKRRNFVNAKKKNVVTLRGFALQLSKIMGKKSQLASAEKVKR